MIKVKICLVGSSAVGKSSLAGRFARAIFNESYTTTVGVRIEKRTLTVADSQYSLIIWDIAAHDRFQALLLSYLRGSSGFLCVLDCTSNFSLLHAHAQLRLIKTHFPEVPAIVAVNKIDLRDHWDFQSSEFLAIKELYPITFTSAKTGVAVDRAFRLLIHEMRKQTRSSTQFPS